jgi:hypothetical protein
MHEIDYNIYRLRTRHCRLRQHLRKMGLHPTALCECGLSEQTPEHILQTCPNMSVKSAALLAGVHCPREQALGNSGGPGKNYQLRRVPRSEGLNGHGRTQKKTTTRHMMSPAQRHSLSGDGQYRTPSMLIT